MKVVNSIAGTPVTAIASAVTRSISSFLTSALVGAMEILITGILHPFSPAGFSDRATVIIACFGFNSNSIHTSHQIAHVATRYLFHSDNASVSLIRFACYYIHKEHDVMTKP